MLFLPESVYEERRRYFKKYSGKKQPPIAVLKRMLDLDPDDDFSLIQLGNALEQSGDNTGAEECYWRAADAQPCSPASYMALSCLLTGSEQPSAITLGLSELGLRKIVLDESAMEDFDPFGASSGGPDDPELARMSRGEQLEALADTLARHRDLEPVEVTQRLRPYRLIQILQDGSAVDERLIDALISGGALVTKLLVGVLRAWARDYLQDEDECTVESTLAILGEVGDTNTIPYLLEFAALEDPTFSGAARWALDRICEKHAADAVRVMTELAPVSGIQERLVILEQLARHPKLDSAAHLLTRLGEELERIGKKDLDEYVPSLVSVTMILLGKVGVQLARAMVRKNSGLLLSGTRTYCEGMIEAFEHEPFPTPPPPPPSPYSVYQICAGEAVWEEELDEDEELELEDSDFLPPEPVHKAQKPGRNDPCWCGSGKKYKKCHLDADEHSTPVLKD